MRCSRSWRPSSATCAPCPEHVALVARLGVPPLRFLGAWEVRLPACDEASLTCSLVACCQR